MPTDAQGRRLAAAVACAGIAVAAAAWYGPAPRAQGAPIPPDVTAVLSRAGASSPDDIATLRAGRVIVRTEVAPDRLEATVVSAVRINTGMERTVTYFRQLIAYVDGQTTLQYAPITRPAEEADFRAAAFDPADLADLRACRPATCDLRVGSASIDDVRALDSSTSEAANTGLRRILADSVNNYQRAGNAALRGYDERGNAIDLPALWKEFEQNMPIAAALAPGLQRYLGTYPGAVPSEATNEMYWDTQRFTGLKPVIGITHLITWRDPAAPQRVIVAQKQIYATHYFFGSLATTLFVQDAETPPATYVVYSNSTRGDLLRGTQSSTQTGIRGRISGIGAGVQRRLGEQMVKQSAERLMGAMKDALERYR